MPAHLLCLAICTLSSQSAGITHVWLPPPSQSVSPQVSTQMSWMKAAAQLGATAITWLVLYTR
jgi:hypothetical protein